MRTTERDPGQLPLEPEQGLKLLPPAELALRVRRALADNRPPTRNVIVRQSAALAIGSWSIAMLVFLLAGGPRSFGRPLSLIIGTALGIGAVAVVAAWAALSRGNSMLGRARRSLVPIIIGSPALILAWKIFWSAQYTGASSAWPTRPGLRCLILSLSLGLCPLIAFAIARRSSDPRRPMLTGFSAGVAIGCVAALLTDMWCPVSYLPHLLLGHLLPIALLGMLGAWMGWRLIAFDKTD